MTNEIPSQEVNGIQIWLSKSFFRNFWVILCTFVLYIAAAQFALQLASTHQQICPFWPAAGIGASFVYLFGARAGIGVFLAAFLANYQINPNWISSVLIACGNTAEAYLGVFIFRRLMRNSDLFDVHTKAIYCVAAIILAPTIAATVGVASLSLTGDLSGPLIAGWLTWWTGDSLGALFVVPLAYKIFLLPRSFTRFNWKQMPLLFFILVPTLLLSYYVFYNPKGAPYLFALFFCLLVSVAWLGTLWMFLVSGFIAAIATLSTSQGLGPFAGNLLSENLTHLQLFLAGLGLTAIALGSLKQDQLDLRVGLALFAGWILSGLTFYSLYNSSLERDENRFLFRVLEAEESISSNLKSYSQILESTVSFISASDFVSENEWHIFAARVMEKEYASGLKNIGLIYLSDSIDHQEFLRQTELRELPKGFQIRPVPDIENDRKRTARGRHAILLYLYPYDRKQHMLGVDLMTDKLRSESIEKALQTGQTAITPLLSLFTESQKRTGFGIYVPFYAEKLKPASQDKQLSARGLIGASVVPADFFKDALEKFESNLYVTVEMMQMNGDLVRVFQAQGKKPHGKFQRQSTISLGGQMIRLTWMPVEGFYSGTSVLASLIGFFGAVCTVFLAVMLSSLQSMTQRAQQLADEKTKEVIEKNAEIQNKQAALIAASRMSSLGTMASGVAHEINNPLAIIMGKSQQIESLLSEEPLEKQKVLMLLDQINKTVYRIAKIIRGLRTFARETTNEEFQDVSIKDVLQDTLELCRERFHAHHIDLRFPSDVPVDYRFRGHSEQIGQVLLNLLNNAFDAVEGQVDKWVQIEIHALGGKLQVIVSDSGPRIPDEIQEKMFTPFFTTKEVGKGTGLGLSISKGIIDRHQGRIYVDPHAVHTRIVVELKRTSDSVIKNHPLSGRA